VSAGDPYAAMNVLHTAVVNFDSLGGDSGANEGWFSPYSRGRAAYADLFPAGHTFYLCLTATC